MNPAAVPDPARAGDTGDPVEMTRALVAVPSVNPAMAAGGEGFGEGEAAQLCARWLEGWGYGVEVTEAAPGRPSVVARRGRPGPSLILNGHLDTVGVEGMTIPPFDPVIREGRLYGRGACDMKGGVAAVLAAARRLALEGDHGGELVVVLTCDEEQASIGVRRLLDAGLRADAAVVTEPTSLAVMPANKGFFWVRALVRGRAAHGSRPDLGRDAIRGAGRILAALDRWEELADESPPHPLLGRGSIHAGTIRGGTAPSVYPERCELVLEARTLPSEDPQVVLERLESVLDRAREGDPELEVEVESDLYRPGGDLAADHPLVEGLRHAARAEGVEAGVKGMTAWVEAAFFTRAGTPSVCFGPGAIGKAHSADEFVPVEEVAAAAGVLTRFARDFLAGGGGGRDRAERRPT